jgi:hypothetical protein
LWNVHRPKNLLHAVLQETHFRFRSINTSVSKYIWSGMFSTDKKSVRCFERIFSEINALDAFCKELKDGAFEGLCDCVCNRFIEWMNDKIRLCTLEHSSQEHIRQYVFLRFGNARNKFKNKDETTLNVYAPCLQLTGLAPLYGIVIPILLIWCDIVTCFTVHDFTNWQHTPQHYGFIIYIYLRALLLYTI